MTAPHIPLYLVGEAINKGNSVEIHLEREKCRGAI
jgi:hypothetical protein